MKYCIISSRVNFEFLFIYLVLQFLLFFDLAATLFLS